MYVAVSTTSISLVLLREEASVEHVIYYVSRAIVHAEIRYPDIEKLALALVVSYMKLRPYFYVHVIAIPNSQPLRQVLSKPNLP